LKACNVLPHLVDLVAALRELSDVFSHFTDDPRGTVQALPDLAAGCMKLLVDQVKLLTDLFVERPELFGEERERLREASFIWPLS